VPRRTGGDESEQAAVHSRVTLRFVPKDLTVSTDLLDLWKFENGKIVELIEFADTALVNDLMK
jgi:ketosteroid isomerase-like protein